jgi:hypothetical protein
MIALAIVAVVLVAEVILAVKWNRFYLTFGLPIFVKRVDRLAGLEDVSIEYLQKRTATAAGTPLIFRRLDPNLIAFREGGLGGFFHYAPLMRGLIRRNQGESSVSVIGFVNWFVVIGTIVLVVLLRRNVVVIAPAYLAAFAILYFIQGVRFWRLAKALREPATEPQTLAPQ